MKIRDRIRELRRVPASELRPNPKNWRTHPEAQANALKGVLAEVGIADAVLARELDDGSLMLLDGHLRVETMGDQILPVLVLDVDEAEGDKILATLDPLAAMAESDAAKLDAILRDVDTGSPELQEMLAGLADDAGLYQDEAKEIVEDEVPEPPVDPITKPGDLWLLGDHRLLCGDSTKAEDVERLMAGETPDCVATDPPYGISHPTDYKARGRGKLARCRDYAPVVGDEKAYDPAEILEWQKPTILWGGNHFASRLPDSGGWLVWDKERPDDLDQATCELAWTNCVKGVRRIRHLWNGMMRRGDDDLVHPTQKPVAVVAWSLSLKWIPNGSVYDPFLGSGTTLIAAEQLGRKCYGMEISPQYCDVIVKRWETLTGKKATLDKPAKKPKAK